MIKKKIWLIALPVAVLILFSATYIGVAHALSGAPPTTTTTTPTTTISTLSLASALTTPSSVILTIWNVSRSLVDVIVLIALFAIAFTNIFHININTYAAKKALPGLVFGVILANASLLIIRFLVDVCTALSNFAAQIGIDNSTHIGATCSATAGPIINLIACVFPLAIGSTMPSLITLVLLFPLLLLVLLIAVIYYEFLILAFAWNLIKRMILIYFLVAVSPLAFIAYGIPNFQKYFTMWWNNFLRYLFLLPIIIFGMSATVILANITYGTDGPAKFLSDLFAPAQGKSPALVDLFGLLMVLLAANLVLNLPKIITKGTMMALDSVDSFKKMANALPGMAAGVQGAHTAAVNWGGQRDINKRVMGMKARGVSQDRIDRFQAIAQGKLKARISKVNKPYETFRAVSHMTANPKMLQDAWKERTEQRVKDDTKFANRLDMNGVGVTIGGKRYGAPQGNLLDNLRGDRAGYKSAIKRVAEDSKDYISESQYAGEVKNNELFKKINAYMKDPANSDKNKDDLQKQIAAATNIEDMQEVATKVGHTDRTSINDLAWAREYERGAIRLGNQNRGQGAGRRILNQQSAGFHAHGSGGDDDGPPPGGGGTDYEARIQDTVNNFPDDVKKSIGDRADEITKHAAHISVPVGTSSDDLQRKIAETEAACHDALTADLGTMSADRLKSVDLQRHQAITALSNSLDQTSDTYKELQRISGGDMSSENNASLAKMLENHSLALAGGAGSADGYKRENVKQVLERSEAAKTVIKSTADNIETTASIDPASMNALVNAVTEASNGNTAQFEAYLGEHKTAMDKIFGQADPKEQQKAMQDMANSIGGQIKDSISGRSPKSLSSIFKDGLEKMHKSLGRQTIDLKNVGTATRQGSSTTVTNVNNSTTVNPTTGPVSSPASGESVSLANEIRSSEIDQSTPATPSGAIPPAQEPPTGS